MQRYLKHTRSLGDCLIWTRCLNSDGYPRAWINKNRNGKVHREVSFLFNGYYPKVVRHSCDEPRCINPEHLLGGNATNNMEDRSVRGRTFGHVSKDEAKQISILRERGMTYRRIAEKLAIKKKRVEYVCTRHLKG